MTESGAAPASPLGEPLVDAATVAAFLGIHVASVYRLAGRSNGLPVVQVSAGVRRFRPADVRAYIERQTRTPQVRSSRAAQLLAGRPRARRNELATSPQQSVHRKQEP
ncbi:MAG: helix-turn-helix domain-containing protein [Candidatus Aureabacteria bacterium]|nr:helix-turn-helix domain-containing protein [Candidatus Auribacterota bacterium]